MRTHRNPSPAILSSFIVLASSSASASETTQYTLDADFDQGTLLNLHHDAPDNDQLQLTQSISTFPFMWIANAGEDTVSKIDTETGDEVARYRTIWGSGALPSHGAWSGPAPSRTAVDTEGNAYVLNRHFDGRPADLVKIRASGCQDRDGVPGITTSTGPGDVIDLVDANMNGILDAGDTFDECIDYVSGGIGNPGGLGRSLSIDGNGDLWVGLYSQRAYYQVDASDGSVLAGPFSTGSNTPYGSLVDGDGILWGASLGRALLRMDTADPTSATTYTNPWSDYGIALGNEMVYLANRSNYGFTQFDPSTNTFSIPAGPGPSANPLGISVDQNGDIVVGDAIGGGSAVGVTKFHPDGAVAWSAPAQGATEQRGCIVDSDNNIWTINRPNNSISKFSENGAPLGTFPVGRLPYTYSDATGLAVLQSNPTGIWTIVQDAGVVDAAWETITWNEEPEGAEPAGTLIEVFVRVANSELDLDAAPEFQVTNGQDLTALGLVGQFISVRTTLQSDDVEITPVLSDLSVTVCLADANGNGICDDEEGGCTYTKGYWKNHTQYGNGNQNVPWPIDEDTDMCGMTWLENLHTPPQGDAFYILSHQYIAASLNVANGAFAPGDVSDAIDQAAVMLADCVITDDEHASAIAAAGLLDDYNNGLIGPGHCDDLEDDEGDDEVEADGAEAQAQGPSEASPATSAAGCGIAPRKHGAPVAGLLLLVLAGLNRRRRSE